MSTAIEFSHVSKQYRLGLVSTKTLSHDIRRFWITNVLHREDPYLKIGETNDRSTRGNSDYVWALRDIDFKVEQGDVVGIIGKNGAGKSTLLKLLSRVTGPTTGTIRAHGRIGSLLEVGTGFHGEMTGRENIFMNGAILGMSRAEIQAKLDEIIDFSGCERYIDTPVKRYSSGMTVRLGFAVAAFLEPEILVVDEVLAVGDAEFQKKAIGKMKDVSQGQGRTVLFVSHNMASVRRLCKTGIVLKNGMMDYMGGVEDAIERYLRANADDFSDLPLKDIPRTDKTNGIVRFLNCEYLNFQDEPIDPHCGQPLRIRLTLDVKEGANDLDVSIGIRNEMGDPVMTFPSECTMDNFALTPGIHYAALNIPKLPLTAGTYRIGLWATANSPMVDCACGDYIDNVIRLKVEDDAFFIGGRPVAPHLNGKVVLCDHNWQID